MRKIFVVMATFLLFFSGTSVTKVEGYKPVYASFEEAKIIKALPPQAYENHGKIYIKGPVIYIGERGRGVHIIDNSNPLAPKKVGFIQILGNHDIAIKGHTMYADNLTDLVLIDLTNLSEPKALQRISDVYDLSNQYYPENVPYHTYFECVDPDKGIVVGWVAAELDNPACFTNY